MQTKQKLKSEMQETYQLSGLVTVYQELAATKIKTVKKEVEDSRSYWESLHLALSSISIDLQKDEVGTTKTAVVWLASEQGLYGGVVQSTRRKLQEAIDANHGATIYVAGKRGLELFREWWPSLQVNKLSLPNEDLIKIELEQLVSSLPEYQNLIVIYGKMQNLLTQVPELKSWKPVGGNIHNEFAHKHAKKHYLYEPDPVLIGELFGTQVTTGVITQLSKENKLAKLAARIMSLEETMGEIDKSIMTYQKQLRRLRSRENDKKQQSRITHQKARRLL